MPSAPPKAISAEVVATQPTAADKPMLASLSSELNRSLPDSAFIVKIKLDKVPEPTGAGWALYVGDTRIPKYWEYPGGIYFKVLDDTFLAEHRGKPLRFSQDDRTFVKTGVKLPGPRVAGPDRLQASTPSPSAVGGPERDGPHALGPKGCTSERTETAPGQEALDIVVRIDRYDGDCGFGTEPIAPSRARHSVARNPR